MITYNQLKEAALLVREELNPEASTAIVDTSATDSQTLEEAETVHLKPHGDKGTHYKVVKGIKGHLEAGEVIHDSEVDDLHDMGYKVKHLKEDGTEANDTPLAEANTPVENTEGQLSEADWKLGADADKGLTKEEEIAVAKGTRYGDYKGHRAAMKKKHAID
jgi:hypothetical protein